MLKLLQSLSSVIFSLGLEIKRFHSHLIFSSVVSDCDLTDCSMQGFPAHHQLPEFTQTHVHRVGDEQNYLIHVVPSSSCLQSFPTSGSKKSVLRIRRPEYWNFSISPSNEYSGLISFRIDWLNLLAVQGTLKTLLQHHSSKTSILRRSVFFMAQLSYPYMTTGKTTALTKQTFVSNVMSLLFNMLPRLVIACRPRSKCVLISWLQSLSAVILEPKRIKSITVSPSICHEVMGRDAMIFIF